MAPKTKLTPTPSLPKLFFIFLLSVLRCSIMHYFFKPSFPVEYRGHSLVFSAHVTLTLFETLSKIIHSRLFQNSLKMLETLPVFFTILDVYGYSFVKILLDWSQVPVFAKSSPCWLKADQKFKSCEFSLNESKNDELSSQRYHKSTEQNKKKSPSNSKNEIPQVLR